MLSLEGVIAHYGNIRALKEISLKVGVGEIVCLIGANGAGKTTTLRTISGLIKPTGGSVTFLDERIDGMAPDLVAQRGISQVPEGRHVFSGMSVMDNLILGAYIHRRNSKKVKQGLERVFTLFPILRTRRKQMAGTMSGGEQQMFAIGRALMSEPKLLLLDEPSMGLAPILVEQVFDIIQDIHAQGTTILLVEQNAAMALSIATKGYVLETGSIVLQGAAEFLSRNENVKRAYLGQTTAHAT
jgi:branched-chain amino acid transport system ATP-binding protein